jgi:hypothetical protein
MHSVFLEKVSYYLEEDSIVGTKIRDEDLINYENSINGRSFLSSALQFLFLHII